MGTAVSRNNDNQSPLTQALIKIFFLYIQKSISHSTTRTTTARTSNSTCPEVQIMPCVKILTQLCKGTMLANM